MNLFVEFPFCKEFDMQKTWREDENKCTFIVLDNALESEIPLPVNEGAMSVIFFLQKAIFVKRCLQGWRRESHL